MRLCSTNDGTCYTLQVAQQACTVAPGLLLSRRRVDCVIVSVSPPPQTRQPKLFSPDVDYIYASRHCSSPQKSNQRKIPSFHMSTALRRAKCQASPSNFQGHTLFHKASKLDATVAKLVYASPPASPWSTPLLPSWWLILIARNHAARPKTAQSIGLQRGTSPTSHSTWRRSGGQSPMSTPLQRELVRHAFTPDTVPKAARRSAVHVNTTPITLLVAGRMPTSRGREIDIVFSDCYANFCGPRAEVERRLTSSPMSHRTLSHMQWLAGIRITGSVAFFLPDWTRLPPPPPPPPPTMSTQGRSCSRNAKRHLRRSVYHCTTEHLQTL
ncbi:hypothetical protein EGR_08741 [Echinococcus granulosus]|uniref:Uncharacterized protein n=1 Tax=Echinococcus granulosus TaxID=6210 RepID=W6U7N9_ECHGR|nr:hypothetical protein EGR_08741 [Echinococcus granulosus]EUB56371.1 hypothetical protein EGR_08741 [Echinococcus granulosus]